VAAPDPRQQNKGETGYSWLFFSGVRVWFLRLVIILSGIGLGGAFYVWYTQHSNDASPDSLAGYAYAIIGTIFLLLAAFLYALRRRSHNKRTIGQLNTSLNLHICFGILGLVFLFFHSFGNFNPRTGTYALYGMIALTISGVVGRFLDRLVPRLIAGEVHKALTARGDDRIETISHELQAIVIHNTLHTPWDLAYISLEATPQELNREEGHYRFIPDKKSELMRPGAFMPGAQEHINELQEVERAMQREQFYRYIIRYWRVFHVILALLTLALTLWHLIYAAQLLLPTFPH